MKTQEVRDFLNAFFDENQEVFHPLIPDAMKWKQEYFDLIQSGHCSGCSKIKYKLIYANKIKKALYGR